MSEFKVGEIVKIGDSQYDDGVPASEVLKGQTGTIVSVYADTQAWPLRIQVTGKADAYLFGEDEVVKLDEHEAILAHSQSIAEKLQGYNEAAED